MNSEPLGIPSMYRVVEWTYTGQVTFRTLCYECDMESTTHHYEMLVPDDDVNLRTVNVCVDCIYLYFPVAPSGGLVDVFYTGWNRIDHYLSSRPKRITKRKI